MRKLFSSACLLFLSFLAPLRADYISLECITPGQLRYSSKNVEQKIKGAIDHQDAVFNEETGKYEGKYCNGKSCFPESEALPVIKAPFGWVLVDGHHHTLAALALDLPYIPVKVIEDLSILSESDFWDQAEKKGYVYLISLEGKREIPSSFSRLQDDPNRYFAAISARKYPANKDPSQSTGAEYPIWVKIGKDIPFIEFRIADALNSAGFLYTYDQGDTPSIACMEEARQILLEAHIPGLKVVPERVHYTQLNLDDNS